eukprot:591321-Amphidinium_carterae.3
MYLACQHLTPGKKYSLFLGGGVSLLEPAGALAESPAHPSLGLSEVELGVPAPSGVCPELGGPAQHLWQTWQTRLSLKGLGGTHGRQLPALASLPNFSCSSSWNPAARDQHHIAGEGEPLRQTATAAHSLLHAQGAVEAEGPSAT